MPSHQKSISKPANYSSPEELLRKIAILNITLNRISAVVCFPLLVFIVGLIFYVYFMRIVSTTSGYASLYQSELARIRGEQDFLSALSYIQKMKDSDGDFVNAKRLLDSLSPEASFSHEIKLTGQPNPNHQLVKVFELLRPLTYLYSQEFNLEKIKQQSDKELYKHNFDFIRFHQNLNVNDLMDRTVFLANDSVFRKYIYIESLAMFCTLTFIKLLLLLPLLNKFQLVFSSLMRKQPDRIVELNSKILEERLCDLEDRYKYIKIIVSCFNVGTLSFLLFPIFFLSFFQLDNLSLRLGCYMIVGALNFFSTEFLVNAIDKIYLRVLTRRYLPRANAIQELTPENLCGFSWLPDMLDVAYLKFKSLDDISAKKIAKAVAHLFLKYGLKINSVIGSTLSLDLAIIDSKVHAVIKDDILRLLDRLKQLANLKNILSEILSPLANSNKLTFEIQNSFDLEALPIIKVSIKSSDELVESIKSFLTSPILEFKSNDTLIYSFSDILKKDEINALKTLSLSLGSSVPELSLALPESTRKSGLRRTKQTDAKVIQPAVTNGKPSAPNKNIVWPGYTYTEVPSNSNARRRVFPISSPFSAKDTLFGVIDLPDELKNCPKEVLDSFHEVGYGSPVVKPPKGYAGIVPTNAVVPSSEGLVPSAFKIKLKSKNDGKWRLFSKSVASTTVDGKEDPSKQLHIFRILAHK